MTTLFDPITVRGLSVRNRIWVSPMCQYSCLGQDGLVGPWHVGHYGSFAHGGFGMVICEATAVNPVGRISPQDAGLWSDAQVAAWRRVTDVVHAQPIPGADGTAVPTRVAVQLAHAGRKASTYRGFRGEPRGPIPPNEGGWPVVGPSPIPFDADSPVPHPLDQDGIDELLSDFVAAARRAADAGFDAIELHMAHGYLMTEFLSPLSNRRTDSHGGSLAHRMALPLEVARAVRQAWQGPLLVRISTTEWHPDGWSVDDSVVLARELKDAGVDLVDCSSGGNVTVPVPVEPGYQVPMAARIRAESGVMTGAVGLISEPSQAHAIVAGGQADVVLLGRAALREPNWPQRAAAELGLPNDQAPYPPQTIRGAWPPAHT